MKKHAVAVVGASRLKEWVTLYVGCVEAAGRSPKTVRNYYVSLRRFVKRLDGRLPTSSDVLAYMNTWGTAGSRCNAFMILRMWFSFLRKRGLLEKDPSEGIARPRPRRRDYPLVSPEEFDRLVGTLDSDLMRLVATILYRVGPRIAELAAVRVEDITFDGDYGTIDFRVRKGGRAGYAAFGPEVTVLLRPHLVWRADAFPKTERAFPLTEDYIRHRLMMAGRKAGIPGAMTPHRLRHCFITNAVDSGWPQLGLQQQIGHSTPMSTAWYYRPTREGLLKITRQIHGSPAVPQVKTGVTPVEPEPDRNNGSSPPIPVMLRKHSEQFGGLPLETVQTLAVAGLLNRLEKLTAPTQTTEGMG